MKTESRAFSLVELLVVTAVIVVLMAVAVPALNSVLAGSGVSRAGQMISDAFVLARQEAVSKNRDVYVRFFKFTDGADATAAVARGAGLEQGPGAGWQGRRREIDEVPRGNLHQPRDDALAAVGATRPRRERWTSGADGSAEVRRVSDSGRPGSSMDR